MKTPKVIKVKKVKEVVPTEQPSEVAQPEYIITITIEHGTYVGNCKGFTYLWYNTSNYENS